MTLRTMHLARITAAFPSRLAEEVIAAARAIPADVTASSTEADIGPVLLSGEAVRIPYRIYGSALTEEVTSALPLDQALVLSALYSRHHDGHVRERAVRCLLRASERHEDWIAPYVVQLLGEYVLEIVRTIESESTHEFLARMAHHLRDSETLLRRTRARATSYWSAYHRDTYPSLETYPAERILRQLANRRHSKTRSEP